MDQFLRNTGNSDIYRAHLWLHKEMGFDVVRVCLPCPPLATQGDGLRRGSRVVWCGDGESRVLRRRGRARTVGVAGILDDGRGDYDWPGDCRNYLESAKDMVAMLHSHCSLVIWCLGNDIDGREGGTVNDRIYDHLRSTGANHVLRSSMGNWTAFNHAWQATAKDGMYGILSNKDAFTWNPAATEWVDGKLVHTNTAFLVMEFNPEAGSSAVPMYESLLEMYSLDVLEYYGNKLFPTTQQEEDEAVNGRDFTFPEGLVWDHFVGATEETRIGYVNSTFSKKAKAYPLGWHNYQGWRDTDGKNWVLDRYGSVLDEHG